MIFLFLFILCLIIEMSPRIDTDNVIKKVGIGFIMVGSLVELYGNSTPFIIIGIALYLFALLSSAYFGGRSRRTYDK